MCNRKNKAVKSQQSKRFFIMLQRTSKNTFRFGLQQSGKCSVTCSIPLSEFRTSSAETGKEALRANLQWKAWSLILGQGHVFLSFFKLGYYITYMHWISDCMKGKKNSFSFFKQIPTALWDQILVQCKWLVWPSVIHSACVCVCVCVCVRLQWHYIGREHQKPRAPLAAGHKCC